MTDARAKELDQRTLEYAAQHIRDQSALIADLVKALKIAWPYIAAINSAQRPAGVLVTIDLALAAAKNASPMTKDASPA